MVQPFLVRRTVVLEQVVSAQTVAEAIAKFDETKADIVVVRESARREDQ